MTLFERPVITEVNRSSVIMTIEGIESYMSIELGERMRTICLSELMRKFSKPFEHVQLAMKKFVQSSNCIDNVYVAVSEGDDVNRSIRIIKLGETEALGPNASWWYYMVKPGAESVATAWSREIASMKELAAEKAPGLWPGASAYASIVSGDSLKEREVKIRVEQPSVSVASSGMKSLSSVQTNSGSANKSKLGFSKVSGPVVAKEEKKEKVDSVPSSQAAVSKPAATVKYQVPLDSLGGEAPNTPERVSDEMDEPAEKEDVQMEEQQVKSSSSPDRNRQKIVVEPEEEEVIDTLSSSPKFREVVIKKKVVVSEYEMNESGEMIVRDVEKMVEEIVKEQIKPAAKKTVGGSTAAAAAKKKTSSAPAGQGTLMGFFSGNKQPKT